MLQVMKDLPQGVEGVDAKGTVTREDYEGTLKPLLENAAKANRRIRFLYRMGPEFEGFTAGAAWEDFSLGMKHLNLFERCAVVTDKEWIRTACQVMAPLVPCPFRVFRESENAQAAEWLQAPAKANVSTRFIAETQVLVVEASEKFTREDFEVLAAHVDPWIKAHQWLQGVVVHAEHFPGWENLGSFFRHVEFVARHHRKVQRIALAVDGVLPELVPAVANYFVQAEIKHFAYDEIDEAIQWAAEARAKQGVA